MKMERLDEAFAERTSALEQRQAWLSAAEERLTDLRTEIERAETALADGRAELQGLAEERRQLRDAVDQARGDIAVAAAPADGLDPLLAASPVQTEDGIRIAHLLFNNASAELSPGARRKVEAAAAWIEDNDVETIRLVGYADATGSKAGNQALSQARAQRTASALAELGVDPGTIEIEAVGDNVLVETTDAQVAEPLNRSVGIFVGE